MQHQVNGIAASKRVPWNMGKLTGAKPPLRLKHVWSIRTKLQIEGRARDLAMFNLAIDSKLRGCDVVAIRVEDVAAGGYTADRATVRQKKTGRPVRFELSEQTRQAVDDYLKVTGKRPGEFLFTGHGGPDRSMTTRQYARLGFRELVDFAKLRWRIERDYLELKQEVGLGHFEGRGWRGFHHHATMCIAAYGFLISERETIPPSGPRRAAPFQTTALPEGYRPRGSPLAA